MHLENTFEVPASPEITWALLQDVPRVIPCMPGARLADVLGEDEWRAHVSVKLGPINLGFLAEVNRTELNRESMCTRLVANAREIKGRGGATATIEALLKPTSAGSLVELSTDLEMTGALAQYGRAAVADIAGELTRQFASNLATQLHTFEDQHPTAAVASASKQDGGGRQGGGSLGDVKTGAPALAAPVGGISLVARALIRSRWREIGGVGALIAGAALLRRRVARPGFTVTWTTRRGSTTTISRHR